MTSVEDQLKAVARKKFNHLAPKSTAPPEARQASAQAHNIPFPITAEQVSEYAFEHFLALQRFNSNRTGGEAAFLQKQIQLGETGRRLRAALYVYYGDQRVWDDL